MASVNLSRLKHHECAKCGSATLALPRKDLACQCGCTLFRVRRPTKEEEDYFVAEYIEEEERERAIANRTAAIALTISGVAVVGFLVWAWSNPVVWVVAILAFFVFAVLAPIFR